MAQPPAVFCSLFSIIIMSVCKAACIFAVSTFSPLGFHIYAFSFLLSWNTMYMCIPAIIGVITFLFSGFLGFKLLEHIVRLVSKNSLASIQNCQSYIPKLFNIPPGGAEEVFKEVWNMFLPVMPVVRSDYSSGAFEKRV